MISRQLFLKARAARPCRGLLGVAFMFDAIVFVAVTLLALLGALTA
jgi:hypothetical protein